MAKNEIQPAADKMKYTFEKFLSDIQEAPVDNDGDTDANEKAEREYQSKLIVMQMLIGMAVQCSSENYYEDEKLSNAIDVKVNGNEMLSGYIFYVSQNPQFDYSWNYMRKCQKKYKDFLIGGVRFLNNLLIDINMIAGKTRVGNDIHVVFNDIFDISLTNVEPHVKARVLWENFHRISLVKRDSQISIKNKECILVVGRRKNASDAERLIDKALELASNTARNLK